MDLREPALVYTPNAAQGTVARIDQYLHANNLYRFDDVQEPVQDLALPAVERPVLRRVMLYATMTDPPRLLITDHLSSLGSDKITQTAVVGALMQCGIEVFIMDKPLPPSWYQQSVQRIGFKQVGVIIEQLLDSSLITKQILQRWDEICGGVMYFLPTSMSRNAEAARLKIKELYELDGLTYTEIATRLSVGGYQNMHDRVVWYTEAVRKAYEAGL